MRRRRYSVVFSRPPGGGYAAYFPAFPEITVWYPTLSECRKAAPEALELHLEGLRALGEKPAAERDVIRASIVVKVG